MRGGIREGAGRPKGAKNKNEAEGTKRVSFSVSCQPEERDEVRAKAEELGMGISELVLEAVRAFRK